MLNDVSAAIAAGVCGPAGCTRLKAEQPATYCCQTQEHHRVHAAEIMLCLYGRGWFIIHCTCMMESSALSPSMGSMTSMR
jgi:hypothetical protein